MIYTVKYKSPKSWFRKTLTRVKGDLTTDKSRCFILDDETRIELPLSYEFIFSPERFLVIQANLKKEAGQI
jgi:hypothetical protein